MDYMLKRFLPFMLTLLLGLGLWNFLHTRINVAKEIRYPDASQTLGIHSKTWPIIHSLGEYPCREVKVFRLAGSNPDFRGSFYSSNRPMEVHVLLGADGTVSKVYPAENYSDGSTADALNAAKQIQFTPATRDGVPVSVWLDVRYCVPNEGHANVARTEDGEEWRVIDE
jgi:hypothetical protein